MRRINIQNIVSYAVAEYWICISIYLSSLTQSILYTVLLFRNIIMLLQSETIFRFEFAFRRLANPNPHLRGARFTALYFHPRFDHHAAIYPTGFSYR